MRATCTPHRTRSVFPLIGCALALLLLLPSHLLARVVEEHDRWYVLRMQGQRAGYMHEQRQNRNDTVVTSSTIHLEIKRAADALAISIESEFIETADGKPVSMRLTQALGSNPSTETYRFAADSVEVTSTAEGAGGGKDGASRTSTRPLPAGQWLTPAAASRFMRERLEAGAKEITLRTIDPASGLDPILYTNTVLERVQIEALGKTVPAIKWRVGVEGRPELTTIEFVDERGVPIRTETSMGGLKVEMLLADRELALSKLDAPELLVSTLVTPSRAIERPRDARSAVYVLSIPRAENANLPGLPFGGAQSVGVRDLWTARVSVDPAHPKVVPDHDLPVDAHRKPSGMVTSDDQGVKRLAAEAVTATDTPAVRAEALRSFVHTHIRRKNLGVGFASAAEVARTREGDCTEHAVLLAAMLRADGIPSRVVSGLVYAEQFEGKANVFGYHMWTQAWLGESGAWTDLDATLASPTFDATHIALATSDLADGQTTSALVSLVPMLGQLTIEVESVAY